MSSTLPETRSLLPPAEIPCGLEAGDHLTRAEFEKCYALRPDLKKAELIEGIVYTPSPVRLKQHGTPHLHLALWIGTYHAATPGTAAADNATLRLDADNEPQPDVLLYLLPECGGRVRISEDDYLEGAPEWVGEVASSTASYDLHSKWNAYRRNQVLEYLVVLPQHREVRWFELRADRYELLVEEAGVVRSRRFPGLWLNAPALLAGDAAALLATLRAGLDDPEHKEFVSRLHQLRLDLPSRSS
jgi:Uma2 family endonuclease